MFIQDLRYAFRGLARRPGFTAIAVITLSLGIGATTAIFSVVQAVLLRPLEFPGADRLVKVVGFDKTERITDNLSPADFLDFEREARSFERMGAHGWVGLGTITGGRGEAERIGAVQVTEGFFPTLQVEPAIGRGFAPEDDRAGAGRVALISDGFWRRRYAADPAIVGQSIIFNALPVTVIGVLPPHFRHLEINPERAADIFTPFRWDSAQPNRGGHFIRGVARLKDGTSLQQGRAELDAIAARLEQQYPTDNTNQGVHADHLLDAMVGESKPVVLLLAGAVIVVLLVACANVANLLLARGTSRLRELALRAAIGADRNRLARQMLTESVALSLLGAAGGVAVAVLATRALTVLAAAGIPRADQIGIDGGVLAFALAAAIVTSVVFGLLPAIHLSRQDLNDALKEGGRQQGAAAGRGARELLIVAEVALSIVLLIGAGLMIRSLRQLQNVDPGFRTEQVLTMEVSLPTARYEEGEQMPFYQRLEERVRGLAGVAEVGAINILPLSNNYDGQGVQIEEHPMPAGQAPSIQSRSITPGYFRAMGIPFIKGREFDAHDVADGQLVVIVSASMAKKFWPGEADVIGKRVTHNSGVPRERQQLVGGAGSRVVVGVVGDVKHMTLAETEKDKASSKSTEKLHAKLDRELNKLADGVGDSDVIVEFNDDSDSSARITANGGRSGRKLGILKARAGRISNALLKRLADDPNVKRIHKDREARASIARTAATVGAKNVHAQYGYTGAGVGVAVIDSGITPWHDDLTVANRHRTAHPSRQLINNRSAKYDDWGHGAHRLRRAWQRLRL